MVVNRTSVYHCESRVSTYVHVTSIVSRRSGIPQRALNIERHLFWPTHGARLASEGRVEAAIGPRRAEKTGRDGASQSHRRDYTPGGWILEAQMCLRSWRPPQTSQRRTRGRCRRALKRHAGSERRGGRSAQAVHGGCFVLESDGCWAFCAGITTQGRRVPRARSRGVHEMSLRCSTAGVPYSQRSAAE